MRLLLVYLIMGCLACPLILKGQQGVVDQVLSQKITTSPESYHHIGLLLRDRLDVHSIYQKWKKLQPSLLERNAFLINRLKSQASQTQPPILKILLSREDVRNTHPYWLTNVIFCEMKGEAIQDLASLKEIEQIFPAGKIRNDFIPKEIAEHTQPTLPGSRENGHSVIGAPYLWKRGYTGYGTKVLNIDSGIFPGHPAYKDRYWGNITDKSQAWFDPGFRYSQPEFCDWHGTHTLGTILGLDPKTADTTGVAFEAYWMGANATCEGRSTEDIIATFQWAMDPDGDSGTRSDVPDVINNSWTDATFSDECQNSLYREVFTALEANGIALVFSAGNTGPGGSSIPPPKNINVDEVNTFTVGVINGNSTQLNIISFSSRGPSDCPAGGALAIKPEVVAPGFQIRSAHIDGGYRSRSGTSMAAPHVSGALLLLKQAFPELPGYELKRALYLTAIDLGVQGEDNDYGRGLIAVDSAFRYLISQGHAPADPDPSLDIAIDSITHPVGFPCTNRWRPRVYLSNRGSLPITALTLNYELDGKIRTTSWVGILGAGERLSLNLAEFDLATGSHQFALSLNLNLGGNLVEYRTLDNNMEINFYSYQPDLPQVRDFLVCKGADAAFFANARGTGEVRWFSQENELLGKGERLWYGAALQPDELSTAIYPRQTLGPGFPPSELEEFANDSSYFIQFDVERTCFLKGFEVLSAGSSQLTFLLKNKNDQTLYEQREIVQKGKQFISLDWKLVPGKDNILMVRSAIPLVRQSEGVDFPIDGAGLLRFNGAKGGRGAFNYFYNWEVEYELPCSRKEVALKILGGNMRANFETRQQDSYFFKSDSLEFLDQSSPAKSWFWDFGDGTQSIEQNPRHLFADSGAYLVFLVAEGKDNCSDAHRDTVRIERREPESVDLASDNGWKVFPNPAQDRLILQNPAILQPISLKIYSPQGAIVENLEKINPSGGSYRIDLKPFYSGFYVLEIRLNDQFFYKKIMIR